MTEGAENERKSSSLEIVQKNVQSVDFSIERMAQMRQPEWEQTIEALRAEIASITSVEDLKVFERDLSNFFTHEKLAAQKKPKLASMKTMRRVLGAASSGVTALGVSFIQPPQSSGVFAGLAAVFAALSLRDAHTSYATERFRMSPQGATRMKELGEIFKDLQQRVEAATPQHTLDAEPLA